jgi:hypothetical protein
MPNEAYGGGIYLSSLILRRHWGFELKGSDLGFGSRRRLRRIAKRENGC